MKLLAKSANGKMIRVGKSAVEADWYFMTQEVINVIGNYKVGDEVVIQTKSEAGSKFATSINNATTANETKSINTGVIPDVGVTKSTAQNIAVPAFLPKEQWIEKKKAEGTWKEGNTKSPDVQDKIVRQSVGNMASRSLSSFKFETFEEGQEIIKKLYWLYFGLVNE
jgi:hypothetical protein